MYEELRGLPIEEALAVLYDEDCSKVQIRFTRPERTVSIKELRVINIRKHDEAEIELVVSGVDPDPRGDEAEWPNRG